MQKCIYRELFPDVITEDLDYEYKQVLNPDNPVKWAKTIVGYANGEGGVMFVGVSNEGEAFGIGLDEIDKTKNLIARINDRHIFPHARVQYMMRSGDGVMTKEWRAAKSGSPVLHFITSFLSNVYLTGSHSIKSSLMSLWGDTCTAISIYGYSYLRHHGLQQQCIGYNTNVRT